MKQTEAARPRRNQFTETMRQSNPRQQDQEHLKTHNKRELRQQYRKSRFSGDKTAPLAVRFHPD